MLSYNLTMNINIASCYHFEDTAKDMIDIVKALCNDFKDVNLRPIQATNGWVIRVEVPRKEYSDAFCFLVLMKN